MTAPVRTSRIIESRLAASPAANLTADDRALLAAAQQARVNAYAPYSRFGVGSAVRSVGGDIYTGANMENASYGLTICAEIGALQRSVTDRDFKVAAIAIVGGPLDGVDPGTQPTTPCGRCRQLIFEASQVAGGDVRVLCANADLSRVLVTTISDLLPHAFGPKDLGLA